MQLLFPGLKANSISSFISSNLIFPKYIKSFSSNKYSNIYLFDDIINI